MTNPQTDEIERVEWFRRDPRTGNFVSAEPPKQFTTEQLAAMAEERMKAAATRRENEVLLGKLSSVRALASNLIGYATQEGHDGVRKEAKAIYRAALTNTPSDK